MHREPYCRAAVRLACIDQSLTIAAMATLAEQIRSRLKKSDESLSEIARNTGIHRVNLTQFKSGSRELPLKSLEALAAHFDLEIIVISKNRKQRD